MGTGQIVVIGGAGFIGGTLVNALADRGFTVKIVSRQAAAVPDRLNVSIARGDVSNADAIRRVIEGADTVFHLATGGGNTWADFERDFFQGARNVAGACRDFGVKRLIYTSSIAALYLGGRGTVTEASGLDPQPAGRGPYARAKAGAEGILMELHRRESLPVVITRPGVVVGRNGMLTHSGVGYWPCDTCCIGWGRGTTPLPLVLATDVADALIAAMEVPGIEGMSFNLAGDVFLTAREFVRITAERSRRHFRFYPQSLWKLQAVEIAKWALKIAARKPDNPFPSYRDLKSRALRATLDCSAAKQILGWKPNADLDVFIADAIESHLKSIAPGDLRLLETAAAL